jgi:predicted lysophospholipase L1 biosynthesis ABC-type transport system permease subunit
MVGGGLGAFRSTVYIDLADGVEASEAADAIEGRVSSRGLANVRVISRVEVVDYIKEFSSFIKALMDSLVALAAMVTLVAVLGVFAADSDARVRELAVYKSLGAPPGIIAAWTALQVMVLLALSAPLAIAVGYAVSGVIAERAANAIGYIEPSLSPRTLLPSPFAYSIAVIVLSASTLTTIKYRRLRVAKALSEV